MADEILLKYGADVTELKSVQKEVAKVTQLTEELHTEVKATFSEKALDEAVLKLHEQGKTMDALILRYGDAGKALKAMQKELQTMAALGQRGTKEFKELADATAELSDTIGDTRGEIKKLASDTRVFDTLVQGARGLTAAFSVATGLTAALGKENEDLQKAILKVQGAMAALQGVQELANLATEKGGILTQAYGVALKGVELISKTFGINMAASWAVATAGLSVLVGGVIALIGYFNDLGGSIEVVKTKADEAAESVARLNKEQGRAVDIADNYIDAAKERIKIFEQEQGAFSENQITLLNARISFYKSQVAEFTKLADSDQIFKDKYLSFVNELNAKISETGRRLAEIRKKIFEADKKQFVDDLKSFIDALKSAMVGEDAVGKQMQEVGKAMSDSVAEGFKKGLMEKVPEMKVDLPVPDLGGELAAQKFITEFSDTLTAIAPTMSAFQQLGQAIFSRETQALEDEKQKQLAIVGDNAAKREQIEKKFAIKRAELERQQAISDKAFATFNAVINLASAISKTIAENGFPAAIPFIALATAAGAAQIAAIASAPLPSIPKYEKGGAVALMGGEIRRDSSIIGHSHRQGGVLINAEGGEYITNKHAAKQYSDELKAANEFRLEDLILHKYVAPALKAAQLASAESYDDRLLRKTIKETSRENAHYIGKSVSKAVSETVYFKDRYGV